MWARVLYVILKVVFPGKPDKLICLKQEKVYL